MVPEDGLFDVVELARGRRESERAGRTIYGVHHDLGLAFPLGQAQ